MTPPSLLAAVQMTSGSDKAANLRTAERLVRAAAARGAIFIGLPENFAFMGTLETRSSAAESLAGPSLTALQNLAAELHVYLLAGSILETDAPGGRVYNTCVLFGPDRKRLAVYRKIHLFDAEVAAGESYRESKHVAPGISPVMANTDLGPVGLSICYDLRFPELYREYATLSATLLTVPSAFTLNTGKDHWEVLLRARAIENLAYVLAPAQSGTHPGGRRTWGHAMIVDPWGTVIGCAADGEGIAIAEFDPHVLERARNNLQSLTHRRLLTTQPSPTAA